MAWKKNVIKADLRSYPPYLIMGLPKTGKTTLFRDLVLHNYKTAEKGLLISCKDEEGYHALDELQVEVARDWDSEEDEDGNRGMIQIIDDLIENKNEHGIEMIGIDTLDKMVELATQEVYEIHRKLKGVYPLSLNQALGGYGAGGKKVAELITNEIKRLNSAGYAVFILAHVKKKDKEDVVTGEVYEQITNNLMSTFYNPVADICQMIVNIVTEMEFDNSDERFKEVESINSKGIKTKEIVGVKKKRAEPIRMMYFRDSGFVDAGCRFTGLPEKLELSAENFMYAFEMGVKNSSINKPISDEEIVKMKKSEEKTISKQAEKIKAKQAEKEIKEKEYAVKKEIVEQFKEKATTLSALQLSQIKDLNLRYDVKSYEDLDIIPMDMIAELKAIINE